MSQRSRRNLIIFLFIGSFTFLMCRCYSDASIQYSGGWSCTRWYEPGITMGYVCTQICPDGGFAEKQVEELSELDALPKCELPSSPTATATETPDAVGNINLQQKPTETATPTPMLPLLTTEMTGCGESNEGPQPAWWVNLRLAEPHLDVANKSVEITIGGVLSSCAVNQSNLSILTCSAPRGITYPADVVVSVDGTEVNGFAIHPSQSVCAPATATKSKGRDDGPESTATVAPEGPPAE